VSDQRDPSILIIGGSGLVGSRAARLMRQLQPELPITIGGRDRARALAVASEIGNADAVAIDLGAPNLGLSAGKAYAAVAMFVKDDTLESLRYAQSVGAAHLSISSGVFEIAPEVAWFVQRPQSAPIVLASYWLAGAPTFAALHFAKEFRRVDRIEIGAVLDELDIGGPAANADYERLTTTAESTLLRKDGAWRWVRGEAAQRRFTDSDGKEHLGQAYTPFDVIGLAAATNAGSVRFDIVVGETPSRRLGQGMSTEMIIELEGEGHTGERHRVRHELIHPEGQAPVTAINVAQMLERLVGLSERGPLAPGLYFPEQVVEPGDMLQQMQRFGLQHRRVS
jgi:hypothetical protein